MSDLNHWHPAMPPIHWLRWWNGGPQCWDDRDRYAAERVIWAAEVFAQDRSDGVAEALSGTRFEVHHKAAVATYFLAASMAVCTDRDGLLADLAGVDSFAAVEVLALADALADYLPDTGATEMEDTGLYRQLQALGEPEAAPLVCHLVTAARLLGLIWRERPGTFDQFRATYVDGKVA